MQGSTAVIDALNEVIRSVHALHEQAHLQEHKFELLEYGFSKWFDTIETDAHEKLMHHLINRVGALGGEPDVFNFAWKMDMASPEIGAALNAMLVGLQNVHAAYGRACDVAENDDDYVTEKMIWKHLKRVEKWINKFEARIAQFKRLGPVAFASEYI